MNEVMAQIRGMSEVEGEKESCNDLVTKNKVGVPHCPHCGVAAVDGNIIKKGRNRNGAQRYYCKDCGRFFVPSTSTALAHTHKSADTWRLFIEMTIRGETLAACASECEIAYQTAFTWRHKVVNVFLAGQEETVMGGIVEADEMLFGVSYKGNHVTGSFGKRNRTSPESSHLPRPAFRRGTDNKSASAKDKVCVFCMVENGDKRFYAGVPGVGFMSEPMLSATLPKHIDRKSAVLLVDQYKTTRNYLERNNYNNLVLASNTSGNPHDHKPEIQGEQREKHMQHVNAMHRHIRNFMKPYFGVSSKYLSNYISMYVWLKNYALQRQRKEALSTAEQCLANTNCYITGREISQKPAVPMCA